MVLLVWHVDNARPAPGLETRPSALRRFVGKSRCPCNTCSSLPFHGHGSHSLVKEVQNGDEGLKGRREASSDLRGDEGSFEGLRSPPLKPPPLRSLPFRSPPSKPRSTRPAALPNPPAPKQDHTLRVCVKASPAKRATPTHEHGL